jgi:hypothetical protein
MNEMLSPEDARNPQDRLRFIIIHNGQGGGVPGKQTKPKGKKKIGELQSHYLAYLCNFATSQWFELNDHEVHEREEEYILEDAKDKAYMLHYIRQESSEALLCHQDDLSLCPSSNVVKSIKKRKYSKYSCC